MSRRLIPILIIILAACARQTQPNGGPKDEDAPNLLSSTPVNGARNVQQERITLVFDEFIKLKDPKEEIIITPSTGAQTKFIAKKKTVTIIPENKLEPNTTYSIAFRNGIQDLNESNPAEDLHLAFSTGPDIDSLRIFGRVQQLLKEKPPEKLLVALYQSDTFDIFKHRPTYFTKTDKKGKFSIPNLKAGKYFIYAFEDKNKNTKVDSKTEVYGFVAKEISLPENQDSIKIDLVKLDSRPFKVTSVKHTTTISMIRFNKPPDSILLKSERPIAYTFGSEQSEIQIQKNFNTTDSAKTHIIAIDSLGQVIDTTLYVKFSDGKLPKEKQKLGKWKTSLNVKTLKLQFSNTYTKPISKINYDSIYIQLDSSRYQGIKPNELQLDTLNKKIWITTSLPPNTTPKTKPILLFGKGAFITAEGDSTKTDDVKIQIPKAEDTGTIELNVNTTHPHYEIRLESENETYRFRDIKKLTVQNLLPGEFQITIYIDDNNNGKWDPGNFYKRIEPEKIILFRNIDGKTKIPLRANWEVGPLLITF